MRNAHNVVVQRLLNKRERHEHREHFVRRIIHKEQIKKAKMMKRSDTKYKIDNDVMQ